MNSRNPNQVQEYDSLVQVDLQLNWDVGDSGFGFTLGGNNVFDEQPQPADFGVCCGLIVRTSTLIDWQGPFWYLQGRFRWQ